jgi:hypothetical protein
VVLRVKFDAHTVSHVLHQTLRCYLVPVESMELVSNWFLFGTSTLFSTPMITKLAPYEDETQVKGYVISFQHKLIPATIQN